MITEKMIDTVSSIHLCITNKLSDVVEQQVLSLANDAEEIGESLLDEDVLPQNKKGVLYNEMISWFVEICSYVENEMDIPAIISDELYDKLVERMINVGEAQPIGSPTSVIIGIDTRPHKYPELRGSLAKVHFLWDTEIPKKDTRKSLEWYLNNVVRQMKASGDNVDLTKVPISVDIKYDGVSHIIEGSGKEFQHVLTRGDVYNNLGKDLTPLFSRFFPNEDEKGIKTNSMASNMKLDKLPASIWEDGLDYGIKVETFMTSQRFNLFKEEYNLNRCNRRSAVMSICNQVPDSEEPDEFYKKQVQFLRMQSFQIATSKEIELDDETVEKDWHSIGKFNGHYNYIYTEGEDTIDLTDIESCVKYLGKEIELTRTLADTWSIPCDGAVITILDQSFINVLGRKDNKNMFQVAFKFPAGEEKTTIEDVDFQVGPIVGRLTPVARLKPIVINGNTISNVTVSNQAKLERLHLHKGDEVLIRYDIIPSIFKSKDCKETDNPLIEFPTECPVCGGIVKDEVCINPDCPSKVVGHILNYIGRLNIKGGLGIEKVVQLVDVGLLNGIGDLYRLYLHRDEMCKLERWGETSVDKILSGISEAKSLYQHQILGSIGIPGVGLKTMEKVCRKLNIIGNLDNLDELYIPMCSIGGIGPKSASAIIEGIKKKTPLIEDICCNVDIRQYESEEDKYTTSVCFTSTHDTEEFEKFLDSIGVKVNDTFTKSTEYLIVPDLRMEKPSTKMVKAEKWNTPMIKLKEAKIKWGYKGD
jgi:NAD-dependent DNA ligase